MKPTLKTALVQALTAAGASQVATLADTQRGVLELEHDHLHEFAGALVLIRGEDLVTRDGVTIGTVTGGITLTGEALLGALRLTPTQVAGGILAHLAWMALVDATPPHMDTRVQLQAVSGTTARLNFHPDPCGDGVPVTFTVTGATWSLRDGATLLKRGALTALDWLNPSPDEVTPAYAKWRAALPR